MKLETLAISPLKLAKLPPSAHENYVKKALQSLFQLENYWQGMYNEPNFIDDSWRAVPFDSMVRSMFLSGPFLLCYADGNLVGVAHFRLYSGNREAEFQGWVAPEWRSGPLSRQKIIRKFLKEDVISYAWETLKLVRLEAECALSNRPALAFAKNLGMRGVGVKQLAGQFQGELCDTVLMEILNPALLAVSVVERVATADLRQSEESDEQEQEQQQHGELVDNAVAESSFDPDFDIAPRVGAASQTAAQPNGNSGSGAGDRTRSKGRRARRNRR